MKCPECNFENDDDFIFCMNCGNKLKTNDSDDICSSNDLNQSFKENRAIDYQYAEDYVGSDDFSANLDKIFSENNFTAGQIDKVNLFIRLNDGENSIEELILDEISNNKYPDKLSDEEYELLLDFSKKIMMDDLNDEGVFFIQDKGLTTVSVTEMKTVKEEVPTVKQKHGTLAKGAATLGFGLVGLAGTSGVKTEMETVEKQVPVQVRKTINDSFSIMLVLKNNSLHLKRGDLKTIINFSEIEDITQENNFVYIKTNTETITLRRWDNYFLDLLTEALSNAIYYLKDYDAIKNKYLDKFFNDLNSIWISKIFEDVVDDNNHSELDKIELIKKYHELKESGIITEEEFEKKKQELLN